MTIFLLSVVVLWDDWFVDKIRLENPQNHKLSFLLNGFNFKESLSYFCSWKCQNISKCTNREEIHKKKLCFSYCKIHSINCFIILISKKFQSTKVRLIVKCMRHGWQWDMSVLLWSHVWPLCSLTAAKITLTAYTRYRYDLIFLS